VNRAIKILPDTDLNDITEPGTYFCVSAGDTPTIANRPEGVNNAFSLQVYKVWWDSSGVAQILIEHINSAGSPAMFIRANSPPWHLWKRLATAEQPDILALPLATGFTPAHTNGCRYWKTQDGIVTVDAHMDKSTGIANLDILATLPLGYRPSLIATIERPAVLRTPFTLGFVQISSNGQLRARHDSSGITSISFHISFPAAQ